MRSFEFGEKNGQGDVPGQLQTKLGFTYQPLDKSKVAALSAADQGQIEPAATTTPIALPTT